MEIRQSLPRLLALLIVPVGLAYGCDALAEASDGRMAGKLTFAGWLFKAGAVVLLGFIIFGNRLLASIKPEGLFAPSICTALIPWGDIAKIDVVKSKGSNQVQVVLVPGSKSDLGMSSRGAVERAAGAAHGLEGHFIPLSATTAKAADVLDAIREAQSSRRSGPPRGGFAASRQPRAFGRA